MAKKNSKSFFKILLWVMVPVLVGAGSISICLSSQPLREAIVGHFLPVITRVLLHQSVSFRAVQIPDWNHIIVIDLSMKGIDTKSPIKKLQAHQIIFRPDWTRWTKGADAIITDSQIEATGVQVDIQVEPSIHPRRVGQPWAGPWAWPKIILHDGLLNFKSPEINVQQLHLNSWFGTNADADTLTISGQSDQLHIAMNKVERDFQLAFTLVWSNHAIRFNKLTLSPSSPLGQRLRMGGEFNKQGNFTFALKSTDLMLETSGTITNRRQTAQAKATINQVTEADMFNWLAPVNLQGRVNLQGQLQMTSWNWEKAQIRMQLEWRQGRILGRPVDRADMAIEKKGRSWQMSHAILEQGHTRVELGNWQWPGTFKKYANDQSWPDHMSGHLKVESNDLPGLIRSLGWKPQWAKPLTHHFTMEGQLQKNGELTVAGQMNLGPEGDLEITHLQFNPWSWMTDHDHAQVQLTLTMHTLALEPLAGLLAQPGWDGIASGSMDYNGSLTKGGVNTNLEIKEPAYRAPGEADFTCRTFKRNF